MFWKLITSPACHWHTLLLEKDVHCHRTTHCEKKSEMISMDLLPSFFPHFARATVNSLLSLRTLQEHLCLPCLLHSIYHHLSFYRFYLLIYCLHPPYIFNLTNTSIAYYVLHLQTLTFFSWVKITNLFYFLNFFHYHLASLYSLPAITTLLSMSMSPFSFWLDSFIP